jgi:dihydroxyacetone kinase-like protein
MMVISRDDAVKWIRASALTIFENRDYLIQLNSATGDADHGANMDRGFRAVIARMPEISHQDIGTIFRTVGMTLQSTIGGAAGPLYGTFFLQAGSKAAGKMELNLNDWCTALEAALDGVVMRGNAEPGDKTMVDALFPAVNALKQAAEENIPLQQALIQSAEAAKMGMEQTTQLVARKGRASYFRERSAGHQDPGATSMFLILKAAADTWAAR